MILPNVRAALGPAQLDWILDLLAGYENRSREYVERRLVEEGLDSVLDDPRTLNALLTRPDHGASMGLTFYIVVRHALLEGGLDDRVLADYLAAVLVEFGRGDAAHRVDGEDERFYYLVDVLQALESASGRRAFLLRAHLGNYALWLSGLFPDRITAWVQRRGAPDLRYYEEVGSFGYRLAAGTTDAASHGLDEVYGDCARLFPELRTALNRASDRWLFPRAVPGIERLLRQIGDG